jgi:hypothetical protein
MIGYDDLLPCCLIPPLLMATGGSGEQESVAPEHRYHLIRG